MAGTATARRRVSNIKVGKQSGHLRTAFDDEGVLRDIAPKAVEEFEEEEVLLVSFYEGDYNIDFFIHARRHTSSGNDYFCAEDFATLSEEQQLHFSFWIMNPSHYLYWRDEVSTDNSERR